MQWLWNLIISKTACIGSVGAVVLCSASSEAGWPDDPASSLVVGSYDGTFSESQSVVSTSDGAAWYAWQDSFCIGDVRLQRVSFADGSLLSENGIAVQEDPTCGFQLPPLMMAVGDGVVMSRQQSSSFDTPIQRFDSLGSPAWSSGYTTDSTQVFGGVAELSSGDTFLVTYVMGMIRAHRVDSSGELVWDEPALLVSGVSSNMRIFGVVPNQSGGAYVFWDSPNTYTRLMYAMLVNADGSLAWDQFVRVNLPAPMNSANSRHTDPVAIADGTGGAMVVFTKGFESGTTPAPLLVQRVLSDGSLAFPIDGHRVSLGSARQFDVRVDRDEVSNDLLMVWRDGQFASTTVQSQRLSVDGDRLWGDEGIGLALLEPLLGSFDLQWMDDELNIVVGGSDMVEMYSIDSAGVTDGVPLLVGMSGRTGHVRAVRSGDGIVVSWQDETEIRAQRVNPGGRLGNPACSDADLASPYGALDFFDVSAMLTQQVDLNEDGVFDFFDVSVFLSLYSQGCP